MVAKAGFTVNAIITDASTCKLQMYLDHDYGTDQHSGAYIYVYMYMYIHVHMHVVMYMYIQYMYNMYMYTSLVTRPSMLEV